MILLRVYFEAGWWAEWLTGCDIFVEPVSFGRALELDWGW